MSENHSGKWQREEGGEFVPRTSLHPWYNRAFWRKQLRIYILQRDPVCKICRRNASEVADHIKSFISAEGIVSWVLFSDPNNLRGICKPCHDHVTNKYDGGFGHRKEGKELDLLATGEGRGKLFISTSIGTAAIDKALGTKEELDELLADIPETEK